MCGCVFVCLYCVCENLVYNKPAIYVCVYCRRTVRKSKRICTHAHPRRDTRSIEYSNIDIVQTKCVRFFLMMHQSSSSAHSVMSLIKNLIRSLCVLHAKSIDIVGKVGVYKTQMKKETRNTTDTIKLGFQHSRKKERKTNRRKKRNKQRKIDRWT